MEGAPSRWAWRCVALAMTLGAAGASCAGADPLPGAPRPSPIARANLHELSRRVLLLGDNQVQYLYGGGVIERTNVADRAAATAVRPVQLDMFAHQLLLDACHAVPDVPIIHVGDAGNSACPQELRRFFTLMGRCGGSRPWVMAPGNHDGYLMGSLDRSCDVEEWKRACRPIGAPLEKSFGLTKHRFVIEYLRQVWSGPGQLACDAPAESDGYQDCRAGRVTAEAPGFLVEARFSVDSDRRWESYVVQLVDLSVRPQPGPRVLGLVLDTVHYDDPPKVLPPSRDPGSTGSIGDAQQDLVRSMLAAHPDALFLLVGHHPLIKLQDDSARFLRSLAQDARVLGYVTGHTHSGRAYAHAVPDRHEDFVELNVGSITDHPNEYRDAQLLGSGSARSPDVAFLWSSTNPGRTRPTCEDSFFPRPGEYLDYRKVRLYGPGRLQSHLLRSQARAWIHFLQHGGLSDETRRRQLLEALGRALANNEGLRATLQRTADAVEDAMTRAAPADPVLRRQQAYMRCVALQAARYEGRTPERLLRRRIACSKPLDLFATADPFIQREDLIQLAELPVLGSGSPEEDD